MANIISLLVPAAVTLLVVVGFGITFASFYKRASKEKTFVRTGLGGEKVIMDGGALVFPIVHEIIPVNMNTLRLVVDRRQDSSLITKDRMRVDVTAEFYVRVGKNKEAIAAAATTLGTKTLRTEELKALIEGKFVDALRSVAASMDMKELHEQRKEFVQAVQEAVQSDLEKNGLELESVSLTGLDQTAREYFNENNAFDAEGLTKLTEQIEERKKMRNEIEQRNRVAIETEKVEADKKTAIIRKEGELTQIDQEKELNEYRARTEAEVEKTRTEQNQIAKQAEIESDQRIQEANIKKERELELARQDKSITLYNKSKDEAAAKADAQKALAEAVRAEEQVQTSRLTEIAEREKTISILKATETAEKEAVSIRVNAEAEKAAANDQAEAIKIISVAEAEKEERLAQARKISKLADAEGLAAMNAAENSLSSEAMRLRERLTLIRELPKIVEYSVKPLEKIESIKIIDTGSLTASVSGGEGAANGVEGIFGGALKYRAQAPLLDHLIGELGLNGGLTELVKKGGGALESLAGEKASAPIPTAPDTPQG